MDNNGVSMNLINVDYKSLAFSERRHQEGKYVPHSHFIDISVSCIKHLYLTTLLEFDIDHVKVFGVSLSLKKTATS